MSGVTVTSCGVVHYLASCITCGWQASFLTEETPTRVDVQREARAHVIATGHTVTIESGTSTLYEPRRSTNGGQR